ETQAMTTEALTRVARLIDKAQEMTRDMRERDPRAHLFDFAEKQLQTMRDILSEGRIPTDDEKNEIGIGRMAIQEFEGGTFDEYASALEEAAGAFYRL